jgi:hypothetical protein
LDIFIKSFNRAYYLERCLRSIKQYIQGDYKITILDDGTPPAYLDRISQLFPEVVIRKSDRYNEKVSGINQHVAGNAEFSLTTIPTSLWREAIKDGSSVFLLLEEDAWLTARVDVNSIRATIDQFKIATLKIGWNGSDRLVQGQKILLTDGIEQIVPPPSSIPRFMLYTLLTNRYKIRTILQRFGLLSPLITLPYYSRYTITSAFFDKQYWLWIWEGAGSTLNEGSQLYRSVVYGDLHDTIYGKTCHEKVRTSFITSSINRLKTVQFDMVTLHHQLNEAWLNDTLDTMQNFPGDFSVDYLKSLLSHDYPHCSASAWDAWINVFKGMYRKAGCAVD